MSTVIKTTLDGKEICLYPADTPGAPVIYGSMFFEVGEAILRACQALNCPPFSLVSISQLRWDEELSPWPSSPMVSKDDHFTGEAASYAHWLEEVAVPYAEGELQSLGLLRATSSNATEAATSPVRMIAGYSMGGLFALYAPYVTKLFWGSVSGSGSVWFPGFLDYVRTHEFLRIPHAIYLSLGDKESQVDNPALQQTETITQELCAFYQRQSIPSVFELNPGDHYTDADMRLARGIAWILSQRLAMEQKGTKE